VNDTSQLGPYLVSSAYLRERLQPQPGDLLYLHLSDLRLAMQRVATNEAVRVLDFGCGGSPYRSLFPQAQYLRADIAGTPELDLVIPTDTPDLRLAAPDQSFDLVLSSQVLEHVPSSEAYLRECRRLLRPGGRLVLTTHGIYEDHGCPADYLRWTDSGLTRAVGAAGFKVDEIWKMTTGPRASLFLLEQFFPRMSARSRFGFCFWPLRQALDRYRAWWHRGCDAALGGHRFVIENSAEHKLYIGVGCVARAG